LFFTLSRSTGSIDNFLTALGHFYASFDKVLPKSPSLNLTIQGLRRLFLSADAPSKAYPLEQQSLMLILKALDMNVPIQVYFGAWLSISFLFALRPQDISTLRWKDVAFKKDGSFELAVLSAKGVKHRPTSLFTAQAVKSILSPSFWFTHLYYLCDPPPAGDQLVFARRSAGIGSPLKLISMREFSQMLRAFYSKCVSPEIPHKLTPYSLRRGSASAYHQAGVKDLHLSQMMRHKSFDTTAGYVDYYSASSSRQKFTAALLQPDEFFMP